jgi:subtilisin family serine protease
MKETSIRPVIANQQKSNNREQKMNMNSAARAAVKTKVNAVKTRKNISQSSVVAEFEDVLAGFTAKLTPQQVNDLRSDPDVEGVYQDYVVTLGPVTTEAAPNDVTAQAQYVSCAVNKAGGFIDGSTKSTWIWILDTGIDLNHPDLNVQTSATYAKSFIAGQTVDDGNGHGTHCAGIAAAKNNGFGVVGVSAGAKVVPVKVLNNAGSGSFTGIIQGLNHVAQYDIAGDVVNMSLGAFGITNCENSNPVLRDCIRNLGLAGTWVCMAAGNNSGGDANTNLPGCVNGTRVITVGALDCSLACAVYSNFGKPSVDWVAVGTGVYSTVPNDTYGTKSGTSMATPVVAGIIHARGGAPISAGNVTCKGVIYGIARR